MVSHTHARANGRAALFCQSLALIEMGLALDLFVHP
jgi:hypothetical protein